MGLIDGDLGILITVDEKQGWGGPVDVAYWTGAAGSIGDILWLVA